MRKVIISTYCHWTSFGSILQSFALQYLIKRIGAEPATITFASEEQIPLVKRVKPGLNMETANFLFRIMNKKKLEQGRGRCFQFMDERINRITVASKEQLPNEFPSADIYIAGSDQIWHPALCRRDSFLDYAPMDKKRISYAASMGVLDIPPENEKKFAALLQNFDSISVREEDMISVIQKYIDKPVLQHIDPTFLISASDWRQYENAYDIKKPYILVYALYWDRALNEYLKKIYKKTGYQIVSIQDAIRPIYANKRVIDAGPAEFLWLIDHAQAVVTSSFHGTAFSVIFNKPFYPVLNPNAPSRINSLLKTLHVPTASTLDVLMDFLPDYKIVNTRIKQETERSTDYLRREIFDNE